VNFFNKTTTHRSIRRKNYTLQFFPKSQGKARCRNEINTSAYNFKTISFPSKLSTWPMGSVMLLERQFASLKRLQIFTLANHSNLKVYRTADGIHKHVLTLWDYYGVLLVKMIVPSRLAISLRIRFESSIIPAGGCQPILYRKRR
jgi:hypothetical protein